MKRLYPHMFPLRMFCLGTISYFQLSPLVISILFCVSVVLLGVELHWFFSKTRAGTYIDLCILLITLLFIVHIGGYLFSAYEVISFDLSNWDMIIVGGLLILSLFYTLNRPEPDDKQPEAEE